MARQRKAKHHNGTAELDMQWQCTATNQIATEEQGFAGQRHGTVSLEMALRGIAEQRHSCDLTRNGSEITRTA